jgi:hypothetical protein
MAETETTPISGTVTLTSADNLGILLIQLPRLSLRLAILIVIVFGFMGAAAIAFDDRLSFTEAPFEAVGFAFGELWPFAIGSFFFGLLLVLINNTFKWDRFPEQNKIVTYIANEHGMTTTDAAGASIHVPWSMVTQSKRTGRYILMKTKPGGFRFAPFSAFSADDGERLWQLVRTHTPVK